MTDAVAGAFRRLKCWACACVTRHRWASRYLEWQCTVCECTNPPYDKPPSDVLR